MLDYDDAEPSGSSKIALLEELASNGEAIVTLVDGSTVEVHEHDTHFYPLSGSCFFTETETDDGGEAESWFYADQIVSIQRH